MTLKFIINSLESKFNFEKSFDGALITVGRSHSSMLSLEHPLVSRRHFILEFVDDEWFIIDEDSSHGTKLNGHLLEKAKKTLIKNEEEIIIPGFSLIINYDGQRPIVEQTKVVTLNLIKNFFNLKETNDAGPFLEPVVSGENLYFNNDKTWASIGRGQLADFRIDHPSISEFHASLIRDMNGVTLIPILGMDIRINDKILTEATVLSHGQRIFFGDMEYVFKENEHQKIKEEKDEKCNESKSKIFFKEPEQIKENNTKKVLPILDKVCLALFIFTIVSLSLLIYANFH